jgi:ADP-ribose pyrophosphatase YjhB (NUDIX family)
MSLPDIKHFNIRVYGLVLNQHSQVLLSDEFVLNRKMTKFPGGGLHFGEGPEECMLREAMEEFGQQVEIIGHFYTTGFFQRALLYEDHQLISIYYTIRFKELPCFPISTKAFDFASLENGSQSFRWADIASLSEDELTFPIDRHVLRMLKNKLTVHK